MTVLANTAEGGSNGTTVTTGNSGGSSGDAWSAVDIQSGVTGTFSSTTAAHGSLSYSVDVAASGNTGYFAWTGLSAGTLFVRAYVNIAANPPANMNILRVLNGTTAIATVRINSTGKIGCLRSTGTLWGTSTNSIPLGAWFRIEIMADAVGGEMEVRLYLSDENSSTATETLSVFGSLGFSTGTALRCGVVSNVGASDAEILYLDNISISDVDWIGPTSSGTTVTPSTVAQTATTNAATASIGYSPGPYSQIPAQAVVESPVVSISHNVSVSTIAATTSVNASDIGSGATAVVSPISSTAIVESVVPTIGYTVLADTIARAESSLQPLVSSGSTVEPTAITISATVNLAAIEAGSTVSPSAIGRTATVHDPVVLAGSIPQPDVIAALGVVNSVAVTIGAVVSVDVISSIATVPAHGASASGNTVVNANTIACSATVNASAVSISHNASPASIAATATVESVGVSIGYNVTVGRISTSATTNITSGQSDVIIGVGAIIKAVIVNGVEVQAEHIASVPIVSVTATTYAVSVSVGVTVSPSVVPSVATVNQHVASDSLLTIVYPQAINRSAFVHTLSSVLSTQNDYAYLLYTSDVYFSVGFTMDMNKELTHIYIAENPVSIVLTPHTRSRTVTGGYTLVAGTPRVSQVARFIEGSTSVSTGQSRASEGFQESDTHMLLMDWDAVVAIDDTFEHNGDPFTVTGIMQSNGYSTRVEVMRRG